MIVKLSWQRFAAILIVILPILDIYSFPFVFNGLSTAIQLFLIIVLLLCKKRSCDDKLQSKIAKRSYCFRIAITIFFLLIGMIVNLNLGFNYRKLFSVFFIIAIFYLVSLGRIDLSYLVKVYLFFSSIACAYLYLQFVCSYLFGVFLPQNILPIETISGVFDAESTLSLVGVYRASSFFSEPASFSQYVIPAVCILLLKSGGEKKRIIIATIYTIAIFLSTSSLGIILVSLVWLIELYHLTKKNLLKWGVILFIFFAIGGYFVLANDYIYNSLSSIFGLLGQANSKTGERVYKGFAVFHQLPNVYKLFGIGLGNAKYYIQTYGIKTIYDSQWYENYEYFNGVSSALIYGGVFCCVSFILAPISFIKKKNSLSALIAFIFLVMSFGASTFFTTMFLFYGVLLICCADF